MKIDEMSDEDIGQVAIIEQSIFSTPWSAQSISDGCAVENNVYLVVRDGQEIVAYCYMDVSYETADLCKIAVIPQYRNKHIAQVLLEKAFGMCRQNGAERVMLEVRRSNTAAQKLYQNMAFIEIGCRKNYYSAPVEDAIIMEKMLPPITTIQ